MEPGRIRTSRIADARCTSPHETSAGALHYGLEHCAPQPFIGLLHGVLRAFGHCREQVDTALRTLDRQMISRDDAFLSLTACEHPNALRAGRLRQGAGQKSSLAVLGSAADEHR